MKSLFFILFLFTAYLIGGQTLPKNITQQIQGKEPKKQLRILDSLAIKYRNDNFTLSNAIARQGLNIAKENGLPVALVKMYLILSRTYRSKTIIDTALAYVDSAKTFAFANNVHEQYGNIFDFEGLIYMRMGNYNLAAEKFYKSIEYSEKENDSIKIRDAFDHMGTVDFYRNDYKSAVKFYKKGLTYLSPTKDMRFYITTLDNIGLAFANLKMTDSALFYQKRAVAVIEGLGDSTMLAESYLNIGSTMLILKMYKEAELVISKAHAINTALNNQYALQLSNLYLGKLYFQTGKFKQALPYMEKAYSISEKLKLPVQIKQTALSLTDVYDTLGDYKRSVFYYIKIITVMEKLAAEENAQAINELSAKYETEKKQQQIQFLTQDKLLKENKIQKDRYVKLFIAILAGLLLLLSIIFIYRFIEKKKDNSLLELQKTKIENQKEELQNKNKEITDSINYAKRIQGSVLPSANLTKTLFPDSFIYFQPKDIVSGDFYWIAQNTDYIYYAVADCTGHGVPGAMMSMLGNSLLNQIVLNSKIDSPDIILKELHFHVVKTLNENMQQRDSKDGMDIALIRVDIKNKIIAYAGAGRPLYIIKNSRLEIYKADKYSIGGIYDTQEVNYLLHHVKIDAPTQLYMFTDGVPDQFGGPKGKKFMTKQLQEFLIDTASLPINEQEQRFKAIFESWKSKVEQTDDVTLISIRLS